MVISKSVQYTTIEQNISWSKLLEENERDATMWKQKEKKADGSFWKKKDRDINMQINCLSPLKLYLW